jgi:hypothetical protein
MTYTDSVLQVLQPRYSTPEVEPEANSEKGRQMDAPDSPTGVDGQTSPPSALDEAVTPEDTYTALATQPPKSNRSVTISETATTGIPAGGAFQGMAASPNITVRQSILLSSAKNVGTPKDPEDDSGYTPTKDHPREILDKEQKLYRVYTDDGLKETAYHVVDFAGFYPIWPIVEFSMVPTGASKDERMVSFTKCVSALLGEMLYVDDTAMIAPIDTTDDNDKHFIKTMTDIPPNFTKLGKHIMISGGSWVFNKKEKGNNDVYGRFRLKSQIPTEDMINRVSFEFSRVGGKNLYKKQHQAMETETPLMLLFVSNGTDHGSILSDTRQMLDLAYDDIEINGMMPEEFENKDIPEFSLRVNVPRMPSDGKKTDNKAFDHYKNQGKKAFHFEVAKEDVAYFKYLSGHAHRLRLDNKHFGKFAKFTATLSNNAPMSDCVSLRRCIQGHLNFHLSSTSITFDGIDNLDASEVLRNAADKTAITKLTLRDLLYRIRLESNAPLFLQLSQRTTGEVDAVIPNTPEAESLAEKMKVQIAAWCHFYWRDTNPGAERFYRKLSDRAFNQVLRHEISSCTWDLATKVVSSPQAQIEMAAIAEFEQQDWVQQLTGGGHQNIGATKQHVDPNVAFPFDDDFSVGTIHGANVAKQPNPTAGEVVEIQDDEDILSALTTKTGADTQPEVVVGCLARSGPNPVVGPTAAATQTEPASGGSSDPTSAGPAGGAVGGPVGK